MELSSLSSSSLLKQCIITCNGSTKTIWTLGNTEKQMYLVRCCPSCLVLHIVNLFNVKINMGTSSSQDFYAQKSDMKGQNGKGNVAIFLWETWEWTLVYSLQTTPFSWVPCWSFLYSQFSIMNNNIIILLLAIIISLLVLFFFFFARVSDPGGGIWYQP